MGFARNFREDSCDDGVSIRKGVRARVNEVVKHVTGVDASARRRRIGAHAPATFLIRFERRRVIWYVNSMNHPETIRSDEVVYAFDVRRDRCHRCFRERGPRSLSIRSFENARIPDRNRTDTFTERRQRRLYASGRRAMIFSRFNGVLRTRRYR